MQQVEQVTAVEKLPSGAQKFTSSRDPKPQGAHVHVEIVARVDTNLPGHMVPAGKHTLLLSREDAAKVLDRVDEHPERWQQAVDAFEREVKKAIEARFDPNGAPPTKDDLERAERDVRATLSSSPSAHYHSIFGESRKPLVSARIVGGEQPAPVQGRDEARGIDADVLAEALEIVLERRAKAKKS